MTQLKVVPPDGSPVQTTYLETEVVMLGGARLSVPSKRTSKDPIGLHVFDDEGTPIRFIPWTSISMLVFSMKQTV